MVQKVTLIDSFTIRRAGDIEVRCSSFFQDENGNQVSPPEFHRFVLEPGADVDAMHAALDAHMPTIGKPAIPAAEWGRLLQFIPLAHTAEAIAARRELLSTM